MSNDKLTEALALVENADKLVRYENDRPQWVNMAEALESTQKSIGILRSIADSRRTPAETVSREAIGGPLKRVWEWFWTIEAKSPEQLDLLEKEVVAKMTDAIYALQLPATQPASPGNVTPAMVHAAICNGWDAVPGQDDFADPETVGYQTKAVMELLASRPPVPSQPVSTVDDEIRAEFEKWAKDHHYSLEPVKSPGLSGIYEIDDTEGAWDIWRTAVKSVMRPPVPSVVGVPSVEDANEND